MTTAQSQDPTELRRRIARETRSLVEAHGAVADGRDVRLEQLDRRVAELCKAVETLPEAEARGFVDDLQQLNDALDNLAAAVWAAMRRNPGARIFPFQLGRP